MLNNYRYLLQIREMVGVVDTKFDSDLQDEMS